MLTDAYLLGEGVNQDLRADVLAVYSPAQAVALTLKVVNYTSQKLLVVLGADMVVTGGERSESGHHLMRYENYIDNLEGERISLPTAKRDGF